MLGLLGVLVVVVVEENLLVLMLTDEGDNDNDDEEGGSSDITPSVLFFTCFNSSLIGFKDGFAVSVFNFFIEFFLLFR